MEIRYPTPEHPPFDPQMACALLLALAVSGMIGLALSLRWLSKRRHVRR